MNEHLWITGASGFSGRHLARYVRSLSNPPRIVGLDVRPADVPDLDAFHVVDLTDQSAVAQVAATARPRWIVHLAGLMPPAGESELWRANVGGTAGLLMGLRRAGVREARVVSIGSAAEYALDRPSPLREDSPCGSDSAYGNSKLAQSLLSLRVSQDAGFEAVVARAFNLIGPGLSTHLIAASLVEQFVKSADGSAILVGNTHTARDFVDVRDAVRAYWLIATSGHASGIYNVCSGVATPIGRLLELLAVITGREPRVQQDPARIRSTDPVEVFGDPSRLRDAIGWRPEIPVERSLQDMLVRT